MATMPVKRQHHFHAESTVLHADLKHPLHQEIKPQAFVKLDERGGYLSEHGQDFRVEGVVSYKKAYTHVAGHQSPKPTADRNSPCHCNLIFSRRQFANR